MCSGHLRLAPQRACPIKTIEQFNTTNGGGLLPDLERVEQDAIADEPLFNHHPGAAACGEAHGDDNPVAGAQQITVLLDLVRQIVETNQKGVIRDGNWEAHQAGPALRSLLDR